MDGSVYNFSHFKFILDNLNFAITEREFLFNEKGEPIDYRFIYTNKTYADLIDKKPEDIIGLKATELYPSSKNYWIDEYYEVVKTGTSLETIRYEESVERYFTIYVYKTSDTTFIISFIDITGILKNSYKFDIKIPTGKMMRDISKIGFFEVNRITFEAKVSDLLNEVVGLNKIEKGFFRKTLLELTHPDYYNKISSLIKDILKGDISEVETEFKFYNRKKSYYQWINFFIFAIEYDESGRPFRYTGMVRDIQKEKKLIEESEEIEKLFTEARRVADLTTFIYNVDSSRFDASKEFDEFIGIDNLRTIEQYRKAVHPEDLEEYDKSNIFTLVNGLQDKVTVYRIIKNEKIKFIQSSVFSKLDSKGNVVKVFGILKDVSEIERARRISENARKSFRQIFDHSPSGIFILNSNFEITMENSTFRELFNIEPGEMSFSALIGEQYDSTIRKLKRTKIIKNLRVKHFINNKEYYFVIRIIKIDEEIINGYEGTLTDISQQVQDEKRILYLATHDVLTDLYNRNYFEEFVVEKNKNYPLGLILCDVDGLKLINDAFGHQKGDELLQSLSKTLKGLAPDYTISRIGGDEFAILVDNADEEHLENIELEIKESIKDLGFFGMNFEVSLGHDILTKKHYNFMKVFKNAENMMYRRKLTDRSSRKSNALSTIMQTLHEKTEETEAHCERVGDYASMLLSKAGYKRTADLEDIRFLSNVHDIGKIATPEAILNKKTKLTEEEYEEIKYHSEAGYKIIKNIIDNENIAFGVLYHHERYDGTGYPHGLMEEEIPLHARILAIADSYDTMIRGRIYQKPISKEDALKDIEKNKGTQFDPKLAEMFIKLMKAKTL